MADERSSNNSHWPQNNIRYKSEKIVKDVLNEMSADATSPECY